MNRRLASVASQHQGAVFNTPAPNTTAPGVICCLENNPMNSGLKIDRHGRGLTHQGDGDAAIGRDEGVIRKQRLGVGPAGDHEEARRRHALLLQNLADGVGAVGRQFPGPIARPGETAKKSAYAGALIADYTDPKRFPLPDRSTLPDLGERPTCKKTPRASSIKGVSPSRNHLGRRLLSGTGQPTCSGWQSAYLRRCHRPPQVAARPLTPWPAGLAPRIQKPLAQFDFRPRRCCSMVFRQLHFRRQEAWAHRHHGEIPHFLARVLD